jgi:bacillithiol biosynthesis cysteine-adding enzyme BshC
VDIRRIPGIRPLAADYAHRFSLLAPFYAGDPVSRDAWTDVIRRRQASVRHPEPIARVIGDQQRRRGAPAAAIAAGQRLADPRTVAIVTGQQVGLFGGPFYTLLKAITALKLAARVERDHHVPTVAVFWADAEDHDWDEVRGCTVLDQSLAPHTTALAARPGTDPVPVARIPLDASLAAALAALEAALPPTEFSASVLAELKQCYAPGAGMADAFTCWLEKTLGSRGLVVFDSSDPAAKPLVQDVFVRELSAPGDTSRRAAAAGAQLTSLGYHAQVEPGADAIALFHLDGARRSIRQSGPGNTAGRGAADGNDFQIGDRTVSQQALVAEAQADPARFSPNVLLRPIVQDALFPTIAYVAGPNELAYLGQLRGVYEHFGIPMPLMYPRASATLADSAAARFLQKYDIPLAALQPRDEAALNGLLTAQMPPAVEQAFSHASEATQSAMTRLADAMPALDPTLEGAARSTLGKMQHDLDTLRGKMIQAAKRRDETLRRQFTRTQALTFPGGHAQERTVGFVSFLDQYGPALVDRLLDQLPLDLGYHWVLTI